jgi:alpha-tubulin suppressor-like RCC1 family protein
MVLENNNLFGFGANGFSQLGDTTTVDKNVGTSISGIAETISSITVSTGGSATFAITTANKLYTWGRNLNGSLGDGTTNDRNSPASVAVTPSRVVSGTDDSNAFTIFFISGNDLKSVGSNAFGQLGNGGSPTSSLSIENVQMNGALIGQTVTSICAGTGHILVSTGFLTFFNFLY